MRKILITGANGVLGSKLIKKFSMDNNYSVVAFTRNIENLSEQLPNVQYADYNMLYNGKILDSSSIIIHTAFPRKDFSQNLITQTVSEFEQFITFVVESKVKGFINISSQSVYGTYREKPSLESDTVNPQDAYAKTKREIEKRGDFITRKLEKTLDGKFNISYALPLTHIRLASLIGIEYPERVINKMIAIAGKDKKLTVQNDKNIFGYMHIDDAAEGIYRFVKNSDIQNWKPIYNFGVKPDYDENLAYIAKIIKELYTKQGLEIKLEINKQDKADKLQTMNSTWFYEAAQWKPEISLKQSIEMIFQNS